MSEGNSATHSRCSYVLMTQLLWAACQVRKIADCGYAGNVGDVFPNTVRWRSRHASRHVRGARARFAN